MQLRIFSGLTVRQRPEWLLHIDDKNMVSYRVKIPANNATWEIGGLAFCFVFSAFHASFSTADSILLNVSEMSRFLSENVRYGGDRQDKQHPLWVCVCVSLHWFSKHFILNKELVVLKEFAIGFQDKKGLNFFFGVKIRTEWSVNPCSTLRNTLKIL